MTGLLFSQRYFRALTGNKLGVEISESARRKLWSWLLANNSSRGVQRDPNDNWISNSSVLEETEIDLRVEHGWQDVPGAPAATATDPFASLRHLFFHGEAPYVFDAVELANRMMDTNEQDVLRKKLNQIFDMHDCPWKISDGEFFKLDSDFVGARLASTAHDALAANNFAGALDEYTKARQYLGSGETKEAIYYAGHSFESVMKVLASADNLNADKLIKELTRLGYFNDLPEALRTGFTDQVLKALPFLRNKLGGHGQGASVVQVPQSYGELAVQLAAAFHNFLITKHLERTPPPPDPPEVAAPPKFSSLDDKIPF